MIKNLARRWQEALLLRRLIVTGRTLVRRRPQIKAPRRFLMFLTPILLVDKPKDWDPDFGIGKNPEGEKIFTNLQKLKLLTHVKDLVEAGRLDEAEKILENAVEQARRAHNLEWTNILLLILAKLAYNRKEYHKAERHYIELNNNFNRPQEHSVLIQKLKVFTALDLAKIYEVTTNYEKAEKLYKHCLSQIQVMNVGTEDYPWATNVLERVLDSYSLFLADRSRVKEALHYRNMVYNLVKVTHGPESERACYCLNELGRLCSLIGEDDEAMEHLAKALRIGKKLSLDKAGLCAIYVNNGLLLMKKRLFSKAKEYCTEARRLAKGNSDLHGTAQADVCLELIDKERAAV